MPSGTHGTVAPTSARGETAVGAPSTLDAERDESGETMALPESTIAAQPEAAESGPVPSPASGTPGTQIPMSLSDGERREN